MPVVYRIVTAAALAAMLAVAMPFAAAAQPDLPDPLPSIPGVLGDTLGDGGSFDYQLNLIESPPPATTDARGVLINTNASANQPLQGLPGSKLGNTDRGDAAANPQNRVTVGDIRPVPASLGVNISAGPSQVTLEDPGGQSTAFTDPESTAPTVEPDAPTIPIDDFVG